MYSLKDMKYPNDWFKEPLNLEDKHIHEIYKESVDLGMFEDNEINFKYTFGFCGFATYLFPTCNHEQLVIAGRIMQMIFFIDDSIDNEIIGEAGSREMLSKINAILLNENIDTGSFSNNNSLTKIERFTSHFIYKLREYGLKNQVDKSSIDLFLKYAIEYFDSILPLLKISSKDNPPHFESYRYIKKVNGATYISYALMWILFPRSKCSISMFLNPHFDRICSNSGLLISFVNDCASYVKEMRTNECHCNLLYFTQKSENISFGDAYKKIVSLTNECIDQILQDEKIILHSINDPIEREHTRSRIQLFKYLLAGNVVWSIKSPRYASDNDSLFIELSNHSSKNVLNYDKIITSFYSPTTQQQ